ncbi:MAG: hypothetical protein LBH58_04015 [Tannerellaceae bacterium]|jgi:hypothetical protein|nr:hypothetical protein [Tannerellaceae bacterium]
MQIKTIKKNLVAKLEDWLSTIEDKTLCEDVKKHLLVSGGSIANMLLNEPVNDYDIYIQDYNTLLRLVNHYVNKENTLCDNVVIEVLEGKYKNELLGEFKEEQSTHKKIIIENLTDSRIALYSINDGLYIAPEREQTKEMKYKVSCISINAISLTDDIQIVVRFQGAPEKIHETFDFIHATNYFTFIDGLVTNKEALISLLEKQLHYQGSLYPLTSVIRTKKFLKRGWNINAGEYLKILFQVSQLDLTDINVLYEQLVGVDVAYFHKLVEILSTIPKEKYTSGYINTLIDRVFNENIDE